MRRIVQPALIALLVVLMGACASIGMIAPKTFNERLIAGYTAVEGIAKAASTLRSAGKLGDSDRDNVVATLRSAQTGLDLAASIAKTDPAAGANKLDATLALLTALNAYLATKGAP